MDGRRRIRTGTGKDGSSNSFARRNEPTITPHHRPGLARANDHLHGDDSIARKGKPKRIADVPLHGAMTRQQAAGVNVGGMGHATAVIDGGQVITSSAQAQPVQHTYGTLPKSRGQAPVHPAMRGKPTSIGKAILDEAAQDARNVHHG
jgi:hypothetical protein